MSDSSAPPRRRVVSVPARKPPPQLQGLQAVVREDPNPDALYLEQEGFEERMAAYQEGQFNFIGLRIEATVLIEETTQTLVSPGLWGIESDVEKSELEEGLREEWDGLRRVLKAVGVPTDQLPLEFNPEWLEWRT